MIAKYPQFVTTTTPKLNLGGSTQGMIHNIQKNRDDTMMANSAGLALNREMDEVVIPTIDKYRIKTMVANAGTVEKQEISKENAYESFLLASATLVDKKVPINNRVVFVTPQYYTYLKLDKRFTSYGDKAQEIATNGAVGLVDNTEVVVAPTDYFPEGVNYIIIYKTALLSPLTSFTTQIIRILTARKPARTFGLAL